MNADHIEGTTTRTARRSHLGGERDSVLAHGGKRRRRERGDECRVGDVCGGRAAELGVPRCNGDGKRGAKILLRECLRVLHRLGYIESLRQAGVLRELRARKPVVGERVGQRIRCLRSLEERVDIGMVLDLSGWPYQCERQRGGCGPQLRNQRFPLCQVSRDRDPCRVRGEAHLEHRATTLRGQLHQVNVECHIRRVGDRPQTGCSRVGDRLEPQVDHGITGVVGEIGPDHRDTRAFEQLLYCRRGLDVRRNALLPKVCCAEEVRRNRRPRLHPALLAGQCERL